jgi:hypothetical protein
MLNPSGKNLLIAAAISVSLSGCASTPTNDRQTTVAQGAGAGAVLGAVLGYAIGGNTAGTLIGAAAGGLIGAGIGSSVADRKAQYARQEDFLVAEIRRNEDFISEADAQNRQIYEDIAQLDRESRRLAREYRAGQVSRDALVRQKATVEKQLATARKVNSLAEQQLADTNQVYSETRQQRGPQDQYSRQLETNVVKLKETGQQSSQNVASLQQMYDGMSI